jgi:hypothetical protein
MGHAGYERANLDEPPKAAPPCAAPGDHPNQPHCLGEWMVKRCGQEHLAFGVNAVKPLK